MYSLSIICDPIWKNHTCGANNFEVMLTFKLSLFGHFAQKANEIWYPGGPVNAPPGYQI